MADDDLIFLASAILLAQRLGTAGRVASEAEIEQSVTNAEKLREELEKRRKKRSIH
jgi:hypothetical protein